MSNASLDHLRTHVQIKPIAGFPFTDPFGVVWELIENPMSDKCILINEPGDTVPLNCFAGDLPLPAEKVFSKPGHWKACR